MYGTSKCTEPDQTEAVQNTLEEGQKAKKSRNEEPEVLRDNLTTESVNQVEFGNMGFIRYHEDAEIENEVASDKSETGDASRENNIVPNDDEEEVVQNDDRVSMVGVDCPPVVDGQDNLEKSDGSVQDENVAKKGKKKGKKKKTDRAAKKGFKDNFITIKSKLSEIHSKAGTLPDFALIVKDNIHVPKDNRSALHAGKYMVYTKGDICDKFFSPDGICFNHKEFFLCENEKDLAEDKVLPVLQAKKLCSKSGASNSKQATRTVLPELSDDTFEDDEELDSNEDSDEDESCVDPFNMRDHAKKVSWGAPDRQQSVSSAASSGGVNVFGRGAEKRISQQKKTRKVEKKKASKEASKRTATDILDSGESVPDGFHTMGESSSRGRNRGRGRGGGSTNGGRGAKE